MIKYIIQFTALVTLISCGGGESDLVKMKSGEYGSKNGEFLIKFPGKPITSSQHHQLGKTEFDEFIFQYRIANEQIYHASYFDFPEGFIQNSDLDELFDQTIKNWSSPLADLRIVNRIENDDDFDKSLTYKLYSSNPRDSKLIKAKLLLKDKRIYFISFAGLSRLPEEEKIDEFLSSFRIYKPKKGS